MTFSDSLNISECARCQGSVPRASCRTRRGHGRQDIIPSGRRINTEHLRCKRWRCPRCRAARPQREEQGDLFIFSLEGIVVQVIVVQVVTVAAGHCGRPVTPGLGPQTRRMAVPEPGPVTRRLASPAEPQAPPAGRRPGRDWESAGRHGPGHGAYRDLKLSVCQSRGTTVGSEDSGDSIIRIIDTTESEGPGQDPSHHCSSRDLKS